MLEAKVIACSVRRSARELYEMLWTPGSFPKWASGLSDASLERDGIGWRSQGPEGPIRLTFSEHNSVGVMDHWVDLGDGHVVYVPMRIIANGDGSEVMLTLFRQPGMSDGKLAEDEAWIRRDLGVLKEFAESA